MTESTARPLYSDEYLDLFDDHLVLKGYYFLKFGRKTIRLDQIESIRDVRRTYFNGLTRHEIMWWEARIPFDWKVKGSKEAIFIKLKGKWPGVGISAVNTNEVSLILHKKLHT